MKRKLAGLILGTAIVGIVMGPAAGTAQACNGQRIVLICPFGTAWSDDHVCVDGSNSYVDYNNCIRPD